MRANASGSVPTSGHTTHQAPPEAHSWFTALDQRWFTAGAGVFLTEVVGVHLDGGNTWIQLQSIGEHLRQFVIRVTPGMSINDVEGTIEQLLHEIV